MQHRALKAIVFLCAVAVGRGTASAHAGLRLSDPLEGATLGDTPTAIRLSFSEPPDPLLSSIRVLDMGGATYQVGRPERAPGDSLSLLVRVRPLARGVYVVNWRIVSALDGHATAGAYAFGVRVAPAAGSVRTASPPTPWFELIARGVFITGLVILLGAAAATLARFGGASDAGVAMAGWVLSVLGLALLAEAQHRNAATSFLQVFNSSVGHALILRALGFTVAGIALVFARSPSPRARRVAMSVTALAALSVIVVHVIAGHAAAGGRWNARVSSVAQAMHFAAVGIWVGGLAALLVAARRRGPSVSLSQAFHRFSGIAAAALVAVSATGAVLTLGVTSADSWWQDLTSTSYGKAVLAKVALLGAIALVGAANRWRSIPAASSNLRPIRRTGTIELAFMSTAIVAAAVLGTLQTPAGGAPPVLSVEGSDFATTVRVRLTTASDQPGPNRFVVHAVDFDRNEPVGASRVSLRFTPIDDPGVAATVLQLAKGPGDSYVGSGSNLSFDGRWRVTALIERAGTSVDVPLELETRGTPQFVSVERNPGQPVEYTVQVRRDLGTIRISPQPDRPGPSKVFITSFDSIGDLRPIDSIVVTAASGGAGATRQQKVQRLDRFRFVCDITLEEGSNTITVIARTLDGTRLRAAARIPVSRR